MPDCDWNASGSGNSGKEEGVVNSPRGNSPVHQSAEEEEPRERTGPLLYH